MTNYELVAGDRLELPTTGLLTLRSVIRYNPPRKEQSKSKTQYLYRKN